MKNLKQLGIYMDHTRAFLMELENERIVSRNILSGWMENEIQDAPFMGFLWTEKNRQHEAYITEIIEIIKHYQQVVLFGTTSVKNELFNLLKSNYLFKDIKIELVNTDVMTDVEMHDFVKKYFKV